MLSKIDHGGTDISAVRAVCADEIGNWVEVSVNVDDSQRRRTAGSVAAPVIRLLGG